MIFEVECDTTKQNELTDRTHTRIVSFIVLDISILVGLASYSQARAIIDLLFVWKPTPLSST